MPVDEMTEPRSQIQRTNKLKDENLSSSFGSFSMSSLSGFGKVLSTAVGSENGNSAISSSPHHNSHNVGARSDSHHARAASGGALSFVGAISGVKSMMGGATSIEAPKSVPKEIRRLIDTFRYCGRLHFVLHLILSDCYPRARI